MMTGELVADFGLVMPLLLERMARPVRKGDFRLALFSLLQRIRSRGLVPAKMEIRAA
jgi:hypothetical protein